MYACVYIYILIARRRSYWLLPTLYHAGTFQFQAVPAPPPAPLFRSRRTQSDPNPIPKSYSTAYRPGFSFNYKRNWLEFEKRFGVGFGSRGDRISDRMWTRPKSRLFWTLHFLHCSTCALLKAMVWQSICCANEINGNVFQSFNKFEKAWEIQLFK